MILKRSIGQLALYFKVLWSIDHRAKAIKQEVANQRKTIKSLRLEIEHLKLWIDKYNVTLTNFTENLNAMVWRKDTDFKYIIANAQHCIKLFKLKGSRECLDFIISKTGEQVFNYLFLDAGIENSFGRIGLISDTFTKTNGKPCHFFEAGIIDSEQILLYVVKIPEFNDKGKFTGLTCIGWDITLHSAWVIHQLNRWIYDKKAVRLHHDKSVFVYYIKPIVKQCDIFKSVCIQALSSEGDICDFCSHNDQGCSKNRLLNEELKDELPTNNYDSRN